MKAYLIRLFIACWFIGMVAFAVWGTPAQGQGIHQKYLPIAVRHIPFVVNPALHQYVGVLRYGSKDAAEIYTVRADSTALTRLTDDNFHDTEPRWSANNSLIAFRHGTTPFRYYNAVGTAAPYVTIVMNADGSNKRLLVDETFGDTSTVQWSPVKNDALLLTTAEGDWSHATLLLASADTGEVRIIGNDVLLWEWGWSPDGRYIYYTHYTEAGDTTELWLYPVTGGAPVRLSNNIWQVDWHPTNGMLLLQEGNNAGEHTTRLTNPDGTESSILFSNPYIFFGWATRGTAVLARNSVNTYDVYLGSINGGGLTPVTETGSNISAARVSPRGDQLLYQIYEADGPQVTIALYLASVTGGDAVRVAGETCGGNEQNAYDLSDVAWAHDGNSLLFTTSYSEYRVTYSATCYIDLTTTPPQSVQVEGNTNIAQVEFLPYSSAWGIGQPSIGYPPPSAATPAYIQTAPTPVRIPLFPRPQFVVGYEWRYLPDGE